VLCTKDSSVMSDAAVDRGDTHADLVDEGVDGIGKSSTQRLHQ